MVIDIHCHLKVRKAEVYTPTMIEEATFFASQLVRLGRPTTPMRMEKELFPTWFDPKGERIVQMMNEGEIEKTVVFPSPFVFGKDSSYDTFEVINRGVAEVAAKHSDRLIPFCIVNPKVKGIVKLVEKSVMEWGVKGIKLDPLSGGYYPNDKAFYPLYEKAYELGLPLIFHTGPRPEDPECRYAHPSYLEQVLADFPSLKIVASHMSLAWWRELIPIAKARPNLMSDISSFQMTAALNYGQFCHILRKVMDGLGKDRVMFGTDGPVFDIFLSRKEWVQLIKDLPADSPDGINFTGEEITCLLHSNAEKLLGLGKTPPRKE